MVIAQKPWETAASEVRGYAERFVELNGVEPPKPLLVTFVTVHESERAADELHDEYTVRYAQSCVDHYEFGNLGLAEIPGYEYYGKLAQNIADHGEAAYSRFLAGLQASGTPDQVVEQLTENIRCLDGAGVIAVMSFADMPPEESRRNQELFAREVLPRLKSIDPTRALGAAPAVAAVR